MNIEYSIGLDSNMDFRNKTNKNDEFFLSFCLSSRNNLHLHDRHLTQSLS